MLPKVTIITPSYNQGQFIEQTILSVINQGYANLEYIIIDGGSTDNTIDIIKKYESHISYWVSEKDNGQSHAFNKGLAKATGEFVGWLNSDDLYYSNSIQKAVDAFLRDDSLDIVFGNYDCVDSNANLIHARKEIKFDFDIYLWTKGCYHANLAGFFRRTCFDNYGGLREDLHYVMDYELYLRFGMNKCKFSQLHEVLGAYRFHAESKTVSVVNDRVPKEFERVFKEYILSSQYSSFQKLMNPFIYKLLRYKRKLLNGSYSINSLLTRKQLNDNS